jgi:hypothetical protein
MSTPTKRATVRPPTRDQWVAALLVGAVVVMLGFASGLGLSPASQSQPVAQPPLVRTQTVTPTPSAPVATRAPAAPPVAYVLQPAPPATSAQAVAPTSPTPTPTPTPTAPSSGVPSTSAPSGGGVGPATSCRPTLLTNLLGVLLPARRAPGLLGLGQLLGTLSRLTGVRLACRPVARVTATPTGSPS